MAKEIPLFPLQTVLFPGGLLPLRIFEARYIDMISRCFKQESTFGVCFIREGTETTTESFYEIGTTAKINDWDMDNDGLLNISCTGEDRFQLSRQKTEKDGLMVGQVELLKPEQKLQLEGENEKLAQFLQDAFVQLPEYYKDQQTMFNDATWVGYRLAELLPLEPLEKQHLLEMEDAEQRLYEITEMMPRFQQE